PETYSLSLHDALPISDDFDTLRRADGAHRVDLFIGIGDEAIERNDCGNSESLHVPDVAAEVFDAPLHGGGARDADLLFLDAAMQDRKSTRLTPVTSLS